MSVSNNYGVTQAHRKCIHNENKRKKQKKRHTHKRFLNGRKDFILVLCKTVTVVTHLDELWGNYTLDTMKVLAICLVNE